MICCILPLVSHSPQRVVVNSFKSWMQAQKAFRCHNVIMEQAYMKLCADQSIPQIKHIIKTGVQGRNNPVRKIFFLTAPWRFSESMQAPWWISSICFGLHTVGRVLFLCRMICEQMERITWLVIEGRRILLGSIMVYMNLDHLYRVYMDRIIFGWFWCSHLK